MQISVVIPTRNRKARLLSLLADLAQSVHPVHEVIVVDASDEPLRPTEYAFALRIVYLRSQPSVCIQRNMGIRAASSPWIFLCDDDMEVPGDYLQKLAAHVQAHPESGAVSGLVLQQEAGEWKGSYPVTSGKELLLKYLFGLSIWGPIECRQNHWLIRRIAQHYARKGNHLSKAGWPVLTDCSGAFFSVPVYGLGASLVRREWLLASPYDEVLDRHGIGDNYGVAMGFPGKGIQVLNDACVYHHHEQGNRLRQGLSYYRRVLALDYFICVKPGLAHLRRRWLLWSLLGNALIFLAKKNWSLLHPALRAFGQVLSGNNPYYAAAQSIREGEQAFFEEPAPEPVAPIAAKPWARAKKRPKRILAIRLQAMGDVVITLPYLQHLRHSLPADTELDFLTREEVADIPKSIRLFHRVEAIGGGRNFKMQLLHALLLLPKLLLRRYDAVLDLQNNTLSRVVRKTIAPRAWSAFDRFSPAAAGVRNRRTIEALGLGENKAATGFSLKYGFDAKALLKANGWREGAPLVVLNPAGAFENRNWPLAHYAAFAHLWLERFPDAQFLVMGIGKIAFKAAALKAALGERLINLVNQTRPDEAFALMQRVQFVLSEDSGLMHMAWVSGVPTLALFGSTRSDWSRPLGSHTAFLDSSDLSCGHCMLEHCVHEGAKKNYCMTRYTPEQVFAKAMALLSKTGQLSVAAL
jgi:ADP-heptose:LPS heptosyltransferase/glycosyltransferase involved in cell wall biosynthesis